MNKALLTQVQLLPQYRKHAKKRNKVSIASWANNMVEVVNNLEFVFGGVERSFSSSNVLFFVLS